MKRLVGEEVRITWLDASVDTTEDGLVSASELPDWNEDQLLRSRGRLLKVGRINLLVALDDSPNPALHTGRGVCRIPRKQVLLVEVLRPVQTMRGPLGLLMGKGASTTRRPAGK